MGPRAALALRHGLALAFAVAIAGAPGASVMAFNQKTGAGVWKGGNFAIGPAAPILINLDGQEQLVLPGADEIAGMDPATGTVLWSHPHKTQWGLNISTPVWGADTLLLVSSAYNNGARLLQSLLRVFAGVAGAGDGMEDRRGAAVLRSAVVASGFRRPRQSLCGSERPASPLSGVDVGIGTHAGRRRSGCGMGRAD